MPASAGMEEPKFIIKLDGKYYVTVAVLEYDPNAPGASAAQKDGVSQVAAAFERGQPRLDAVQAPMPHITAHVQTGPDH